MARESVARRLSRIVVALASSLALAGCSWGWANYKRTDKLSVQHVPGSSLQIDNANGGITVRTGPAHTVMIDATIKATSQQRLDQVTIRASRLDDGTLVLDSQWPGTGRKGPEGVEYVITMPDVADVRLRTSNGDLNIAGALGAIDLHTSNGEIDVVDAASTVVARSSNGEIRVGLRHTASGPVAIKSSNGDVSLSFGSAFAGTIRGDTSNGSVTIMGVAPDAIDDKGRTKVTLSLPGSGESVIETSNGDLTINRRAE